MQTEYTERYVTLGLKIAYYRKKPDIHRKPSQKRLTEA